MKMKTAFTLFELIVVVIILALLIGILSPFVVAHLKRARIIATKDKMEALNEALQLYYECQFDLPSNLSSLEPDYIRSRLYSGDYMEDPWRKTIVYSKSDSKTATLTSYGPNRSSGGGDDIIYYVDCTGIYKDDSTFSQYLPSDDYKYDPWGKKSEPGAPRGNGQPYHFSTSKKTFYSCGPDGSCGNSDDIYPSGVP